MFSSNERLAVFIDGAGLYSASRNLGFDVDYRAFKEWFAKQAYLIRVYYYSAVLESADYTPLKPLTDWLAYNGFALCIKPAKEFTDGDGRRRIKGGMEVEIAVEMFELAATKRIDHMVLVAGNGDYRRAVEAVQRLGVRVSVMSSIRTSPPLVADELRRQADQFIELADVAPNFTRRQTEPRERNARPTPARPNADVEGAP